MKALIAIVSAVAGLAIIVPDAEARRFGGGRSLGMQRSAPVQQPPKAPAQQQQAAPANAAPQPAGASKWLAPLTGLALGAGLAALFLNNGIAGLLSGLLLLALLVAAMMWLGRALRGRTAQQPLQFAGAGADRPAFTPLAGGAGAQSVAAATSRWPAGFDEAEFVRHARRNFMRLQEAHDRHDLAALRDVLSPAVYREIEADLGAAGDAPQKTDVLALDAEVIEVAEEAGAYVVSVRFSGTIREGAEQPAAPFRETWHLQKPVDGSAGWVVAGIQQS